MKEIQELIKRVEAEINKTPTGELRNLLCDANIVLQQQALNIAAVSGSFPSRKWLMDVIDEVIDTNQTLGSANIADGIIDRWEGNYR